LSPPSRSATSSTKHAGFDGGAIEQRLRPNLTDRNHSLLR
jgi:hypothetical protein